MCHFKSVTFPGPVVCPQVRWLTRLCRSCLHLSCLFVVVLPPLDRMLFHHRPPPLPTISQNNSIIQLPIYTPGWRDRHCGSTPNLSCPGTQHRNAARDQMLPVRQLCLLYNIPWRLHVRKEEDYIVT